MTNEPLNRNFWLALTLLAFLGGLTVGQVARVNEELDRSSSAAAASIYSEEFIELRSLDVEAKALSEESLEADFSEVDRALVELE